MDNEIESLFFPSCHEATVIALNWLGDDIVLRLEDVKSREGIVCVEVTFSKVERCMVDSNPSGNLGMLLEDGEILALTLGEEESHFIIEWHAFQPLKVQTVSYRVTCAEIKKRLWKYPSPQD